MMVHFEIWGGIKKKKERLRAVIRDTLGEKLDVVSRNLAFITALLNYFPDRAGRPR